MAGALTQLESGDEAQYAYGKQLMHEGGIEAQAWAGAPGGKGAPVVTPGGSEGEGGIAYWCGVSAFLYLASFCKLCSRCSTQFSS